MADKPTYTTIAGGAVYSATRLNTIFDTLATAIQGCVGRGGTGESPNSMTGDLDLDGNEILNVGTPTTDGSAANKAYVDSVAANIDINVATAGDLLTAIKTVDGHGSGLDADTLDGQEPSSTTAVSTVVTRDASGDFAGETITADTGFVGDLTGNVTGNLTGDVTGSVNGNPALDASESQSGFIEIATAAEGYGTSANLAVTPRDLNASGRVLQVVTKLNTTGGSTSATIPFDDTIPQNTEGAEFDTIAITPKSTTSTLVVRVSGIIGNGTTANNNVIAIFRDTGADAIAALFMNDLKGASTEVLYNFALTAHSTSGSTSETTFKVRYGAQGATTNIGTTCAKGGASLVVPIEVWEIEA